MISNAPFDKFARMSIIGDGGHFDEIYINDIWQKLNY